MKVICSICGENLTITKTQIDDDGKVVEAEVEPCACCLETNFADGYDEGLEQGMYES